MDATCVENKASAHAILGVDMRHCVEDVEDGRGEISLERRVRQGDRAKDGTSRLGI